VAGEQDQEGDGSPGSRRLSFDLMRRKVRDLAQSEMSGARPLLLDDDKVSR